MQYSLFLKNFEIVGIHYYKTQHPIKPPHQFWLVKNMHRYGITDPLYIETHAYYSRGGKCGTDVRPCLPVFKWIGTKCISRDILFAILVVWNWNFVKLKPYYRRDIYFFPSHRWVRCEEADRWALAKAATLIPIMKRRWSASIHCRLDRSHLEGFGAVGDPG